MQVVNISYQSQIGSNFFFFWMLAPKLRGCLLIYQVDALLINLGFPFLSASLSNIAVHTISVSCEEISSASSCILA